jgi:hypothetical protein
MKKSILFIALGAAVISASSFVISSNGIAGQTGAPGENTCAGCHSGGAGTTSVSISTTPSITSNQYIPGQTYTVTITVANASFSKFGFGCEILNASNANAGVMANAQTGVTFANSGTRKNAIHNAPKTGTGSASFSFEWTAPTSGNATIYAAGNAVNGTGSTAGDRPGNTSLALTMLGVDVKENAVSGFNLNIYPNPTANQINLDYLLTKQADVKIALFDLKGSEVKVLVNEKQEPGQQNVSSEIDEDIEKGIYIIKLSIDNKSAVQKLFIKH